MNAKRSLTWLVNGLIFRLAPLDHPDLDDLYRKQLLPMGGPLRSSIEKVVFEGGQDEAQAAKALRRCLGSFRAILAVSLRKAQPWMTEAGASTLVAVYCGEVDDGAQGVALYRQIQVLGKSTLEGLVSQHRERLTELVSLAESFEAVVTMPWDPKV